MSNALLKLSDLYIEVIIRFCGFLQLADHRFWLNQIYKLHSNSSWPFCNQCNESSFKKQTYIMNETSNTRIQTTLLIPTTIVERMLRNVQFILLFLFLFSNFSTQQLLIRYIAIDIGPLVHSSRRGMLFIIWKDGIGLPLRTSGGESVCLYSTGYSLWQLVQLASNR